MIKQHTQCGIKGKKKKKKKIRQMSVFFPLTTRCTHFICNFTIIAFCYLFISPKLKFPSGSCYKAVFVCSEIITHDFTFSIPLGVCQECFIQKREMNTESSPCFHCIRVISPRCCYATMWNVGTTWFRSGSTIKSFAVNRLMLLLCF